MKNIYTKPLFLFFGFLVLSTQLQAQSIPEVLYYKFDRTDTIVLNEALNVTAANDTAFFNGAIIQDSTGQCGHALVGAGNSSSTDYVNTGWAPNLGGSSWTLSFWSNNLDTNTYTTLFYIFGDNNTSSFRCFTNGAAGVGNWILRGAGLTDVFAYGGALPTPTVNTFAFDSATNVVKAYVNGIVVDSVPQTTVNVTGTGPFKIGGYSTSSGLESNVLMDEFRFYNRCLSDSEVAELMYVHTVGALTDSACHQYITPSGQIITTTGIHYDTIPNSIGCDSIITMDILIKMNDTTVTQNGATFTATQTGVSYQWVDCNNGYLSIVGETSQNFTATANGSYAVILTGDCIDTSACHSINNIGINDNNELGASVYPNPNQGSFNVTTQEIADLIIIRDILGNEIYTIEPNSLQTTISISDQAKGIYFITITKDDKNSHIRVVVTE